MRKGFIPIWVLIVVIAAVVAAGGVMFVAKETSSELGMAGKGILRMAVNQSPASAVTSTAATSSVDISKWETYKNYKYGFKFSYPPDHTPYTSVDMSNRRLVPAASSSDFVAIAENESDVFGDQGNKFTVEPVGIDESINIWLDENLKTYFSDPQAVSRKETTVAGKSAAEINVLQPPKSNRDTYKLYVVKPGNYFLVIAEDAPSTLFDAIFSTLSFTP